MRKITWVFVGMSMVVFGKTSAPQSDIVKPGKMRLDLSTYYETSSQAGSYQDSLSSSDVLRYGILDQVELYASVAYSSNWAKMFDGAAWKSSKSSGLQAVRLGGMWQIKGEENGPAVLIGADVDVLSRDRVNGKTYSSRFRSPRVYGELHYSVDPLTFSLKTTYTLNRTRTLGAIKLDPANTLQIAPTLYFSVNPTTSLHLGAEYTRNSETKTNQKVTSPAHTEVAYVAGASYEVNDNMRLGLEGRFTPTATGNRHGLSATLSVGF